MDCIDICTSIFRPTQNIADDVIINDDDFGWLMILRRGKIFPFVGTFFINLSMCVWKFLPRCECTWWCWKIHEKKFPQTKRITVKMFLKRSFARAFRELFKESVLRWKCIWCAENCTRFLRKFFINTKFKIFFCCNFFLESWTLIKLWKWFFIQKVLQKFLEYSGELYK